MCVIVLCLFREWASFEEEQQQQQQPSVLLQYKVRTDTRILVHMTPLVL
jgi:hypothetical protein